MAEATQTQNLEQLLERTTELKTQAAQIQEELTENLDRLTSLVDEAELDQSFRFNDWSFSCTSRTSYDYPQEIREIEGILKTAKRNSEADGSATPKVGAPFWTIKSPKP